MNPYDPDTSYDQFSKLHRAKNDSKIILNILEKEDHLISKTWTHLEASLQELYTLQLVDQTSDEFQSVQTLWKKSVTSYSIKKIERLENPFTLAQFLIKKEEKLKKCGAVSEVNLFHGTNESCIDQICRFNFDWRLRGKSRGHKFGQGVSFARDAYYSTHYTQNKLIFLVAVLVYRKATGCDTNVLPPEGCDTTTNTPGTVLVKFEDAEFYPRYLIHCE